MWQDDATHRPIRPDLGGVEGDRNSLSDAAPVHVTSESSLARLNDWVLETALERGEEPRDPLAHQRFRPNVVVAGGQADNVGLNRSWPSGSPGSSPRSADVSSDQSLSRRSDAST